MWKVAALGEPNMTDLRVEVAPAAVPSIVLSKADIPPRLRAELRMPLRGVRLRCIGVLGVRATAGAVLKVTPSA